MSDQELLDTLTRLTRENLVGKSFERLEAKPIVRGGSGRMFYRLRFDPGGERMILMCFNLDRPDHGHFLPVTDFLKKQGVRVPRVHARLESEDKHGTNYVWLEDLGRDDLWSHRDHSWNELKSEYEAALDEVAKIHRIAESDKVDCPLEPGFDEKIYRWEQRYFVEQFLKRYARVDDEAGDAVYSGSETKNLARGLAELPRFLVHRDFQSQNIIVREGQVGLIDYQGMRWGRPEYDVASLLLDPYTYLTHEQRGELLEYYHKKHGGDMPYSEFRDVYLRCAAQRLMQALGAYGFLSAERGMSFYISYIPTAVQRLQEVVRKLDTLSSLEKFLHTDNLNLP